MQNLLDFLSANATGIVMLILIVVVGLYAMNSVAKTFNWGRYKRSSTDGDSNSALHYGVSIFFVNLINDFKHLLALVIVIIFTGLIIYSMAAGESFDEKLEALKLVIVSLGGLLGSIIGYYFGESAARGASANRVNFGNPEPPATDSPEPEEDPIMPAPMIDIEPQG